MLNDSDLSEDIDNLESLIAIIGMACRFPGAKDYHQFWGNLEKGINSITEVFSNRWNLENFYSVNPDSPNKSISKWGGFIEDVDKFDPKFFGISPREARLLDPQQRLMLELSWSCLEDSGYSPTELAGTNVGVFIGVCNFDYKELLEKYHNIEGHTSTGTYTSIIPNRISYFFNFHGLSVPVDTACSSSLVAIHQAINALKENECAMALVGGVNVLCSPTYYISFSKLGMLSPQGQCKTFDAKADGYVRGEGAGVILLKPLKNAIKDKDYIYGVIKGSAVNHGGAARTLTSPNVYAQSQVIQAAYTKANIPPNTVSYIEAHGTGTPLGDPIEINGLKRAFTQLYQQYGMDGANEPYCGLSTVKTNIGHLESAAGIAGIIKVLLAMKHKKLPKITNYQHLNPRIKLDGSPFYIVEETKYWEQLRTKEGDIIPRRAGVSSFGFGGVNAHVVLEEAPALLSRLAEVERNHHLLTISAKCEEALLELAQRYEDFFATHPESSLADMCFTANVGRSHFEYRLAVVAESNLQLRDELTAFATSKETFKLVSGRVNSTKAPKIAFLFTGQGSQYIGMGRQLYELSPTFRQTLDRCDSIMRPYLDEPLLSVLYPEPGKTSPINETAYTQPALFALEYALAELWQSWGIKPAVVMGHSVGEYVAATVAGVFSLEDGLKLIAARGRLMQALPSDGEMVAALASERQVAPVIEPYLQEVAIAALNGHDSVVISGKRSTIRLVVAQLEAMGIKTTPLQVSHAFHSPLIEPMLEEFARVASEVTYSPPKINLISNVTGELAEAQVATPEYWCRHVRCSVRFAAGMEALYRAGYEVFVECGPKPILLGMGRKCLPEGVGRWLPSLRPGQEDWQQILQSLAQLYVEGLQVDWSGFDRDYARRRLQLPTYPFQRSRYWFERVQDLPTEEKTEVSLRWETVVAASSYQAQQGPFDLELHTYQAKLESYDSLTTAYIISALQNLGIYRQAGERHSVETLLPQFKILPTYRKLLSRWLERLVREGILQQKEQVFVNQKPLPKVFVDSCLRQARESSANAPQLINCIQRCGENLAEVLIGKVKPLELIFPDGSSEITNYLYQQSPEARYFNGIARSVMEGVVKNQPQAKSLRILEVGAGTGGTTGSLLPILPKERTTYWFTHVSELFLEKAKQKFKIYPFVRYSLLDIEQNPQNQGYPLHSFDVVVAVNVLHATRNIEETLENVRSLLAPGGLLLILEATNPPSWLDITFALIEGWQRFEDNRRGNNPLLSRLQWESVLRDCGFERVLALPSSGSPTEILSQNIIVAQTELLAKDSRDFFELTWTSPNQEPTIREVEASPKSDRFVAAEPSNSQQSWESRLHEKVASILGISIPELNIDTSLTNLGFDSLMAVELTNWIAKELQVNIPIVSFPAGANITQLTNHVREAMDCAATKAPTEYQPYPCLIPLQPQGSKPPFFCVHPIAGVVFPYYELSSLLGKEQPFYGLQSYGLAEEGKPLTRIEDMAHHYIQAMRSVQPQGPYYLGGWSFGAYVAYEMAQKLQQDGQEVALLAVIDTPLLSQNKIANLFLLFKFFMVVSLRYIWPYVYDYFSLAITSKKTQKNSKKRMSDFDKFSFIINSVLGDKTLLDESKSLQLQQPILRRLILVIQANSKALVNYVPTVYSGKITLFQGSQLLVNKQDKYWGWKDVSLKGVEILQIPGHHLNCLRMPHVKVMAEKLVTCIHRIESGAKDSVSN